VRWLESTGIGTTVDTDQPKRRLRFLPQCHLQYHEAMPHAYDPHPGFMELREPEYGLHAEASVTPAPTPPIRFEPDEPQAEQSVPDHVFIEMYDSAAAEHRAAAQEAQSGLPAVDIRASRARLRCT
jgi:hypothetical protein